MDNNTDSPPLVTRSLVAPSFGRRVSCITYELILLAGLEFFLFLFPITLWGALTTHVPSTRYLVGHFIFVIVGYFVLFWCQYGQTLPMKTWKIKILNQKNESPGLGQALLRISMACLGFLPLGIGFWWALWDPQKQFLHDKISGTRLINIKDQ